MTFFLDDDSRSSNSMIFRKARNTANECCALKSPLFYKGTPKNGCLRRLPKKRLFCFAKPEGFSRLRNTAALLRSLI